MKVHVIGGGPAGLYFRDPDEEGVAADAHHVLSATSRTTRSASAWCSPTRRSTPSRPTTARAIAPIIGHFAYWDDIEIHFRGTTHRIGGNGFCGCSRTTLLKILGRRARSLGVELKYQSERRSASRKCAAPISWPPTASIRARASTFEDRFFNPTIDLRPNKFAWMGSTRPFDAFTFFFRETEHGIFIAHCYQYQPGRSTWVMETDPETYARAGLANLDEEASARFLEGVFADQLKGHRLITNRSLWRNFPTIRCESWTPDNIVLIGDAKATAHFSIGSGTKLAMEDAIALSRRSALRTGGRDVKAALTHFETKRATRSRRRSTRPTCRWCGSSM